MRSRSTVELCLPAVLLSAALACSFPTRVFAAVWVTVGVVSVGHRELNSFPTVGIDARWQKGGACLGPLALPSRVVALVHAPRPVSGFPVASETGRPLRRKGAMRTTSGCKRTADWRRSEAQSPLRTRKRDVSTMKSATPAVVLDERSWTLPQQSRSSTIR